MEASVINSGACSEILLTGRFDFHGQKMFLDAVEAAVAADTAEIRLDFRGVDYIDTTALGLLLKVRELAKNVGKTVSLVNAKESVKRVLDIANFSKIFGIT